MPAVSGGERFRALTSVRIDHVIYGTADLDAAAARLRAQLGLVAVDGGRHDGLGTHNRIVPLEDGSFLELLAVADPDEAKRSALGAALQSAVARGEGLLGWAVAVDDLQPVAERLGTPITHVGRQGMTARLTGLAEFLAEPCLPFFIERDTAHAGPRGADARSICWIEVAGDARRLRRWLGGGELPVRVVEGEPAVRAVGVGERELRTT
jgi:catechol 2,3-dioxygenase-like lactoylglutathione lyase family enzyme